MKYVEFVNARDGAIKSYLLDLVEPERVEEFKKKVDAVFEKASLEWEKSYLPILFGKDEAKKIIAEMNKDRVLR